MTPELHVLLGSIVGGTGALLSYWAGWRARGDVMRIRGGVLGPPPLIFNEGPTQRGNGRGGPTTPRPEIVPNPQPPGSRNPFLSEFQQQINDALHLDSYQPRPSRPGANPPPSEP